MNIRNKLRLALGLAALLCLPACYYDDAAYAGADYGPAGAVTGGDIVIRSDGDFYGPLSAYGTWETVDGYGRCWAPAGVGADWQPYEDGLWVSTDAGWYWQTDEPWGWATYHYGRWFDAPGVGWCWVPGTQWAPAWVAWSDEGEAIGWAPLPPAHGFFAGGFRDRHRDDDRRHFVFVPRRDFQQRVRPADAARYRAEIAARSGPNPRVAVTLAAPSRATIEQASGRPVPVVSAHDERRRTEADFAARWHRPAPGAAAVAAPPARREDERRPRAESAPAVVRPAPQVARPVPPVVVAAPPPPRAAAPEERERNERRPREAPPAPALPAPRVEAAPRPPAPPPPAGIVPARPAPGVVHPAPPPPAKAPPPPREKRDDHQQQP
ncbi:MAG TPA: DUF6600 domain-containing protein [Opitutaceae bacterium]|nr:DUF6600 domain-containing protein [Opitutaceae bacterium]